LGGDVGSVEIFGLSAGVIAPIGANGHWDSKLETRLGTIVSEVGLVVSGWVRRSPFLEVLSFLRNGSLHLTVNVHGAKLTR